MFHFVRIHHSGLSKLPFDYNRIPFLKNSKIPELFSFQNMDNCKTSKKGLPRKGEVLSWLKQAVTVRKNSDKKKRS